MGGSEGRRAAGFESWRAAWRLGGLGRLEGRIIIIIIVIIIIVIILVTIIIKVIVIIMVGAGGPEGWKQRSEGEAGGFCLEIYSDPEPISNFLC